MTSFKDVTKLDELANFLEIPLDLLVTILYKIKCDNMYTSFDIPKKDGTSRHINAPNDQLKKVQKKIAHSLYDYQKKIWEDKNINPCLSHGFEKNKSIITNAKIHRNKRFILNIDLENFFDSFHFGRVKGFFEKNNYFKLPINISTIIAQLTCFEGCLPQGAPTSPIITNYICNILDIRLFKTAKKYKLDYTRYADDLTFSTNIKNFPDYYKSFFAELSKEINRAGFKINKDKIRLQYKDCKQKVTGLIVNKKINVDRQYYKLTRAMADSLYRSGDFRICETKGDIDQLEGRFSFINQVEKYNKTIDGTKHDFRNLSSKDEQYRKFLFYKYFFNNNKPLIVTEGKTDIAYLKSAIKSLYNFYPNLISLNESSKFEFKISFLRRSETLRYLFGISSDGADTMKNIYNCYIGIDRMPNYLKHFKDISKCKPNRPVILIFDNESKDTNKPLFKFHNCIKGKNKDTLDNLSTNLQIKITDNLYLATNPLVSGKNECEIEDLFDYETLSHEIGGKHFSRENKFEINTFYGKRIFSQYIYRNYRNINFDGFKPLLDAISEVVNKYT